MSILVSVIVPVYNDPAGILTTLRALAAQSFPRSDYELIVADNGSTDDTRAVVMDFRRQNRDLNLHLVIEDDLQGSYAARNRGIAKATGEILGFVDADMWMDENWLSRTVARMEQTKAEYMGLNVEIRTDSDSLFACYNKTFGFQMRRYLTEEHFSGAGCLLVRRGVLKRVGQFDARLVSGGDRLFGRQVHASGIEQHFAGDITLYHGARTTLRALTKKSFRVGRGNCQLVRHYPDLCQDIKLTVTSFLPVRPAAYLDSVTRRRQADGFPLWQHLAFYLLACYTKWARSVGYLYEAFFRHTVADGR